MQRLTRSWGRAIPITCGLASFVCVLVYLLSGPADARSKYKFFAPQGSEYTTPTSINSKQMIAGYFNIGGNAHGFLRAPDGTITTFDPTNSMLTWALGINERGAIAGEFSESLQNVVMHGFVRSANGKIATFDPTGSTNTYAPAINQSGQIAGYFTDQNGEHGFLRAKDGTFTAFDPPNSTAAASTCINSSGVIAGSFQDAQGLLHGFVRAADGTITAFDPTGSVETFVQSINFAGTITGYYSMTGGADPTWHGFVRSAAGTIATFDPPEAEETYAESINDNGLIAGYYYCQSRGCRYETAQGFVRATDGSFTTFKKSSSLDVVGINSDGYTIGSTNSHGYPGFLRSP